VRTPVDDFNSLLYEDFFTNQQQKTGQQLQRKLQWLQHFVGERGAYSEDCALRSNLTESIDFLKKQQQRSSGNGVQSPLKSQIAEGCECNDFFSKKCEKCSDKTESYDLTNCGLFSPLGRRKETFSASWPLTGFHLNLGKWHGDVTIHRYHFEENFQDSKRINEFLEQIRTFAKIRHENIALFMGATIELPLLAVVTSVRKGDTLYDVVRCKRKKLSLPTKISIARQIAQ
uniref:Serine-threonine/tyrosine-protein kinase catalytic domain-containing protein n=1 Tax=Romanomermis culicivorax TaxID=13658 RepID=A0A915JFQ1_ROMCU